MALVYYIKLQLNTEWKLKRLFVPAAAVSEPFEATPIVKLALDLENKYCRIKLFHSSSEKKEDLATRKILFDHPFQTLTTYYYLIEIEIFYVSWEKSLWIGPGTIHPYFSIYATNYVRPEIQRWEKNCLFLLNSAVLCCCRTKNGFDILYFSIDFYSFWKKKNQNGYQNSITLIFNLYFFQRNWCLVSNVFEVSRVYI